MTGGTQGVPLPRLTNDSSTARPHVIILLFRQHVVHGIGPSRCPCRRRAVVGRSCSVRVRCSGGTGGGSSTTSSRAVRTWASTTPSWQGNELGQRPDIEIQGGVRCRLQLEWTNMSAQILLRKLAKIDSQPRSSQ